LLVTEETHFSPAEAEVVVVTTVLESVSAVLEATTADADVPPKLEPIPDPEPNTEASFDAAEIVADKPLLADGLELKPAALSVLEAADEADDPNSDPDPTLGLDLTDKESELEMLVAELPNEKPVLSELAAELEAAEPREGNRLLAAVGGSELAKEKGSLEVDTTVLTKEEAPKEAIEERLIPAFVCSLGSSFFSGELLAGDIGS